MHDRASPLPRRSITRAWVACSAKAVRGTGGRYLLRNDDDLTCHRWVLVGITGFQFSILLLPSRRNDAAVHEKQAVLDGIK